MDAGRVTDFGACAEGVGGCEAVNSRVAYANVTQETISIIRYRQVLQNLTLLAVACWG